MNHTCRLLLTSYPLLPNNMPLKLVKRFDNITEAELAKNYLREHGIGGLIENAGVEFAGDLGDGFGASLLVQDSDWQQARELLSDDL